MAFPVTLNGRTYTLADFSGTNYVDGFPDALEDFVTQAGNIYVTTSTSSVAIGTGAKTFTVADSGKPYTVGTPLRISDSANPATNWIDGIVTSYSGTTLILNAVAYAGSGTISSWNINIGGGPIAYTGTLPIAQGGTGATTASAARTNLDVYSTGEIDAAFLSSANDSLVLTNAAGTEFLLRAFANGAVELYYDNALKLATTSVGVDVTGEFIADSYNETFASLSGTTPTVDCETANVFALTTSGNTTFTFSNPPATATAYGFTLKVTAGGTHTLTWPASVDWAGGTAPDAPASGETDIFAFFTHDGGTTWYGFLAGDAMA